MSKMLSSTANSLLKFRMMVKLVIRICFVILFLQIIGVLCYNKWLNPLWDQTMHAMGAAFSNVWHLFKQYDFKTAFGILDNALNVFSEVQKNIWMKSFLIWFCVPIFMLYLYLFSDTKINRNEFIRGKQAISPEELNKLAHKKNMFQFLWMLSLKKCLPLGKVWLPIDEENKQTLMVGRPGTGKTNAFNQLILKVRKRKQKAIIHDYKGDYVEKFYNPKDSILFNPLDERSVGWCLFNDCKSVMDIEAFAGALIPDSAPGSEPFWNNAARDVLVGVLRYCYANNKRTNKGIWEVATTPNNKLYHLLKNTTGGERGAKYLEDSSSTTAASIMSNFMQYVKVFEYLSPMDGDFSLTKWVEDKNESRTIFITNYAKLKNTLNPIISLFIQTVGSHLLSQPEDIDNRVHFFLDEFGQMQSMSTLQDLMTASRSKGGCVYIGIQDIGQIINLYKENTKRTILNSAANRVVFNVRDQEEAKFLSEDFGKTEYYEAVESQSLAMTDSDRITTSRQRIKELLITPEMIQALPNLHAFMTIAHYNPTLSIWKYKNLPNRTKSFMQRPELDLVNVIDIVPFVGEIIKPDPRFVSKDEIVESQKEIKSEEVIISDELANASKANKDIEKSRGI